MAWIAPIAPSPRHPKPRWQARYQDGRRQLLKGEGTVSAAAYRSSDTQMTFSDASSSLGACEAAACDVTRIHAEVGAV
jgi:hypothetical protein